MLSTILTNILILIMFFSGIWMVWEWFSFNRECEKDGREEFKHPLWMLVSGFFIILCCITLWAGSDVIRWIAVSVGAIAFVMMWVKIIRTMTW